MSNIIADFYYSLAQEGQYEVSAGAAYVVLVDEDDGFPELIDKDAVVVWKHDGVVDVVICGTLDQAVALLIEAEYANRTVH